MYSGDEEDEQMYHAARKRQRDFSKLQNLMATLRETATKIKREVERKYVNDLTAQIYINSMNMMDAANKLEVAINNYQGVNSDAQVELDLHH